MIKQLLLSFGMLFFVMVSNAQDVNKGNVLAGSSQTTTANGSISGWIGNRVAYVDANTSTKATGIGNEGSSIALANLEASLFPNPVVDATVLTIKGISQEYTLRIFDNQGKNVTPNNLAGKSFKQSSMEISFNTLPAGYFLVDITTIDGKAGKTIKILKTN